MNARYARGLAALFAAAIAAAPAQADHSWILPSGTLFSGSNNVVTFDAAGSEHVFFYDHRAIALDSIRISRPDGSAGEFQASYSGRLRTAFDVRLDQSGTWKVASRQAMVMGSFKLNGEERRVGGRPGGPPPGEGGPRGAEGRPKGAAGAPPPEGGPARPEGGPRRLPPVAVADIPAEATDVHLTEIVNTAETFVTQGQPSTTPFAPAGRGLEMQPITHPNDAAAGDTSRFRFLIDGKPAAGLKVTVIPGGDRYREVTGTLDLVTAADGIVAIKWPAAGMFWVGTAAEDEKPAEPKAQLRKMSYAATIEVATP